MAGSQRRTPTVIVARRARPGREREFERWLNRLVARAADATGYIDAVIQPPDVHHPDEWLVVYQFENSESLDRWMRSPTRTALLAGADELVEPGAREQIVAAVGAPVTAVSSVRVRPEHTAEHRAVHAKVIADLESREGFVRVELYGPVEGVQDDTIVFITFDGRDRLDDWLASERRRELLVEMEPFIASDRTVNVVGGYAGWFASTPAVRRWKSAVAVLLAIVPVGLAFLAVRTWLFPDLHPVVAALIGNVVGVAALTWLLMPWITRRLERWLRAG